jgi:hypothetical protein
MPRRIKYPQEVDDFGLAMSRLHRNSGVSRQAPVSIEDLAYAIAEVQRMVGPQQSTDSTSLEYRLRQIESLLGITSPTPVVATPSQSEILYTDQYQASFAWLVTTAGLTVQFNKPHAALLDPLGDYEAKVRAFKWNPLTSDYTNVDVGFTREPNRLTMVPAADYVTIEWMTKGSTFLQSEPRREGGTLYGVGSNGFGIQWDPYWTRIFEASGDYAADVQAWAADGTELDVAIVKAHNFMTVTPAAAAAILIYKCTGYTQGGIT